MFTLTYPEFDPVLIEIGPLVIRWYALAYIAGILVGWQLALRLTRSDTLWQGYPHAKKATTGAPFKAEHVDDFLLWATFGIILGGRLGFVLFYNLPHYLSNPLDIFAVWEGGMSFHGGLAGVILATIVYSRRNSINMFALGDVLATVSPIGLFFGRIANFINGELWGRFSEVPWAMVFPNDRYGIPRHPSQLYEAGLEGIVLFCVVLYCVTRMKTYAKPGMTIGIFLAGYGLARLFVEFFREPDPQLGFLFGGFLTMGMLLSLPMIALGGWFIWRARQTPALGQAAAQS